MEDQKEYGIIKIERNLKEEKKEAIVAATLRTIASSMSMLLGIANAYMGKPFLAFVWGAGSILWGINVGTIIRRMDELDEKIRKLKR